MTKTRLQNLTVRGIRRVENQIELTVQNGQSISVRFDPIRLATTQDRRPISIEKSDDAARLGTMLRVASELCEEQAQEVLDRHNAGMRHKKTGPSARPKRFQSVPVAMTRSGGDFVLEFADGSELAFDLYAVIENQYLNPLPSVSDERIDLAALLIETADELDSIAEAITEEVNETVNRPKSHLKRSAQGRVAVYA